MVSRINEFGGSGGIGSGGMFARPPKSAGKKRNEKISDYWGEGTTPEKKITNKALSKAKNKREKEYDKFDFPSGGSRKREQQDQLFDVGMRYTNRIKPKPKGQPQKGQNWPRDLEHTGPATPPKVSTAKGTRPKTSPKKKN